MDATASENEEKSGMGSEKKLDILEGRIAPDNFDERYRTTKTEIYAYYWCVGK